MNARFAWLALFIALLFGGSHLLLSVAEAFGPGGGGMGGFLTGRGTANLLTRTTAILAACFMVTSLTLTLMAGGDREAGSILDTPPQGDVAPAETGESAPAEPAEPSVPVQ